MGLVLEPSGFLESVSTQDHLYFSPETLNVRSLESSTGIHEKVKLSYLRLVGNKSTSTQNTRLVASEVKASKTQDTIKF